jgi:cysteine synthase
MPQIQDKLKKLSLLVGNTPTISISCELDGKPYNILAKYEVWNYTGSIKDRMAYRILESAYKAENITAGDTIVEATSGNTGVSFAAMGAYLGHPVQIYMPDWLSDERKQLLRFYGAELIEISADDGGFLKCIELANAKTNKNGFYCPKQFKNTWNVVAHQLTTAPELENAMKINKLGDLRAFIAGVGTGGTVMGFHHYFNNFSAEHDNFVAYPLLPVNNDDRAHRIEGIGDSFIPEILDLAAIGPVMRVSDTDAINISRQMNKLGLSVGISSGANVFGAIVTASELPAGANVATVLPDGNKKYLTTDLCSTSEELSSREIKILDYTLIS